jgi:hypothetical protein
LLKADKRNKGKDHLQDESVDGRIISKCILKNRVCGCGLDSGQVPTVKVKNFRLRKRQDISLLAEKLSAS